MFRAVFLRLCAFLAQHDRFSRRRPQSGVLWSRSGRLLRQAFSGLCWLKACHQRLHAPDRSCNGTTRRRYHFWSDVQMRERLSTCHRSHQHDCGALMAYHSSRSHSCSRFPGVSARCFVFREVHTDLFHGIHGLADRRHHGNASSEFVEWLQQPVPHLSFLTLFLRLQVELSWLYSS